MREITNAQRVPIRAGVSLNPAPTGDRNETIKAEKDIEK
jgi:hypothetical protein